MIFYFDAKVRIGIDPLAHHYAKLFPAWQARAATIAAKGEQLPFGADSFDIVLCLFSGLPLRIMTEGDNISDVKRTSRQITIRHVGDWVKRLFFKNARCEVIALKPASSA